MLRLARPRAVHRRFELERQDKILRLRGTALELLGEDIRAHLDGADQCFLLAATLGPDIDRASGASRCGTWPWPRS